MSSKLIVFLGLLFVTVLLVSSEVAAAEASEAVSAVEAEIDGHGGGGYPSGGYDRRCRHGCCGYYKGHCRCCRYAGEVAAAEASEAVSAVEAEIDGHGGGGYPRPCRYGCCGKGYYRGRCRCCTYAGEKVDADFDVAKP